MKYHHLLIILFPLVKWLGEIPNCISQLNTIEGIYSYDEIMTILDGPEWTKPITYPPTN